MNCSWHVRKINGIDLERFVLEDLFSLPRRRYCDILILQKKAMRAILIVSLEPRVSCRGFFKEYNIIIYNN